MHKKVFVILFVMLSMLSVKGQDFIYGPTLSYQYQKGSAVKIGGNVMTGVGFNNILRADITGNLTWMQGKFAVIPEVAFSYYFGSSEKVNLFPFFVRAEVTPFTVVPKVGISVLTLFDIDLGYGFSIRDKKDYLPIKGFTGSVRFSLPLNM